MRNVILSQVRGDTRRYRFQRVNADGSVITDRPDKLYFTVKKNYDSQDFIFQKKLEDFTIDDEGNYRFTIEPDDTEAMKYGQYVFDIEVITGDVTTTLAKGNFNLETEVTFKVNED